MTVDGHLWVVALVGEHRIRADLNEDLVKCDRVNVKVLPKKVVVLFVIFVGRQDEGKGGGWSSVADFSFDKIST